MANSSKQDEGGTPCRPSRGFKRWFILAGLFMVSFLELGSTRVLSLLLDDFTFQFDVSTSYIGAIYGLVSGMPYFLGLITVPLLRYFSVRLLTIVGGILATGGLIAASFTTTAPQLTAALIAFGFGFVFIVLPTNSSPTDYFPDYFEIATGVLISGGSVGVMVMPWLFDIIIDNYGWRGGLLLLGALNSHYILIGSLLKPTKGEAKKGLLLKSGWYLFASKGLSDLRAAQLSIAGGVANFIGRFSCGFITSKEVASIEVWYMIASALSATAFFVNYVADSFWFLTALSVMFGFSIGFKAPAQFTLVMNAVGKEHFKIGLGILFLVGGSVYPFVGLISGAIYDRTQSYDVTFCIMGALDVIAGILMIALLPGIDFAETSARLFGMIADSFQGYQWRGFSMGNLPDFSHLLRGNSTTHQCL
nr:LOW QUALITY PROTEIN: monocarboxylate transporter 3-like [Lytechinus pictus]